MMGAKGKYGKWIRKVKYCQQCEEKFKKTYFWYAISFLVVPILIFFIIVLVLQFFYLPYKLS